MLYRSGHPVRLVGPTLCSGRIEIYVNSSWGTICGNSWDLNDASVACRELGCGGNQKAVNVSTTSGPVWLENVVCSGGEPSLTTCQHRGLGPHSCSSKHAGVVCSGETIWVFISSSVKQQKIFNFLLYIYDQRCFNVKLKTGESKRQTYRD